MNKLYSSIKTELVDPEVEITQPEVEQYAQSSPNKVYTQIVPEKPNILAEERIFVYVPKVGLIQLVLPNLLLISLILSMVEYH